MAKKKNNEITIRSSAAEYLTYIAATGDEPQSFEMRYEDENIWLTQKMLAALYDVEIPTINEHISKVFLDNELEEEGSDCPSQTIAEEVLQTGVTIAINQIIAGRDGFITILSKNIETVLGTEFDMDTDAIDAKLGTLQDEIMRPASSKSDYDNLASEIHRLRSIKQETQEHNAQRQTKRQRISEMTEFLDMQSGIIAEYDDKLTRQLIEQITVFADKLQVSFKSGVDIEVEI